MVKTKEEVYNIALDIANKVYVKCIEYAFDIEDTNITLADYDINGAIDSLLINSSIDEDESLRDGMYEILEDIASLEFQMYLKEDIDILMGMYDCVLSILLNKMLERGYRIYTKIEDCDYDFGYYVGEVKINGIYDLEYDDLDLIPFMITIPYDLVAIMR